MRTTRAGERCGPWGGSASEEGREADPQADHHGRADAGQVPGEGSPPMTARRWRSSFGTNSGRRPWSGARPSEANYDRTAAQAGQRGQSARAPHGQGAEEEGTHPVLALHDCRPHASRSGHARCAMGIHRLDAPRHPDAHRRPQARPRQPRWVLQGRAGRRCGLPSTSTTGTRGIHWEYAQECVRKERGVQRYAVRITIEETKSHAAE